MTRLVLSALCACSLASAQFARVEVDAATREGELRPWYGIDAPSDEGQARLLLERGGGAPVRLGPDAALRAELADSLARARFEETPPWRLQASFDNPLREAVEAVRAANRRQDGQGDGGYYARRNNDWFDQGGNALPVLAALELAAGLLETPRRLRLRVPPDSGIDGVAGVSEDGQTVKVLLTRLRPPGDETKLAPSYLLYVRNLPWAADSFTIERFRLDDDRRMGERIEEGSGRGGLARVGALLGPPALELIVLRRQEEAPASRVIRRRRRPAR